MSTVPGLWKGQAPAWDCGGDCPGAVLGFVVLGLDTGTGQRVWHRAWDTGHRTWHRGQEYGTWHDTGHSMPAPVPSTERDLRVSVPHMPPAIPPVGTSVSSQRLVALGMGLPVQVLLCHEPWGHRRVKWCHPGTPGDIPSVPTHLLVPAQWHQGVCSPVRTGTLPTRWHRGHRSHQQQVRPRGGH